MSTSNTIIATREAFGITLEPTGTFNITPDFETKENIEITDPTSFVLKNATQIERFEITATGGVATIVKRGLTQADTPIEDVNLRVPWGDGEIGYITSLAFNQFDAQDDNTILNGKKIQFGSSTAYIYSDDNGITLKFKDGSNAERTLTELSNAGSNDKTGTSIADTIPGYLDDKIVPGDGLDSSITNPGANELYNLVIDLITTNGLKFTTGQLDIEPATNIQIGTQRIATDPEAVAGILENVSINPKQAKDNYGTQTAFIVNKNLTQSIVASTETTVIWQTEISDDDGVFASNQFTAPNDGLYQFNCSLSTSGSEASFELRFTNGSGTVYQNNTFNAIEQIGFLSVSTTILLSQNDIVEIRIETSTSSTIAIAGTTFSGFKI